MSPAVLGAALGIGGGEMDDRVQPLRQVARRQRRRDQPGRRSAPGRARRHASEGGLSTSLETRPALRWRPTKPLPPVRRTRKASTLVAFEPVLPKPGPRRKSCEPSKIGLPPAGCCAAERHETAFRSCGQLRRASVPRLADRPPGAHHPPQFGRPRHLRAGARRARRRGSSSATSCARCTAPPCRPPRTRRRPRR